MFDKEVWFEKQPILKEISALNPCFWMNDALVSVDKAWEIIPYTIEDIKDAQARLERFSPLIKAYFKDTAKDKGLIESELRNVASMKSKLSEKYNFLGNLYLKMDSHLPIAGSIKARGGIYEVLKHAEDLALENGILNLNDDYRILAEEKNRTFFSQYKIQVGSTGNLGLSIGIISATLGFNVIVHMSQDAKQWKKDLLRSKGVNVIEYKNDYSEAVKQGRSESDADPASYFIDDENSINLFMGYAVAALRLKKQLADQKINVSKESPLFVYIPCGVGGAPGGVAFGLKKIFEDNVHVFFVEPTHSPCVLIGMATQLNHEVCVQDFGIDGITEADGLAVGRASGFVGEIMSPILSGIFTLEDKELFNFMRDLKETENLCIEPSACAAFEGVSQLNRNPLFKAHLKKHQLTGKEDNINHIAWATGGLLVPPNIMEKYLHTFL